MSTLTYDQAVELREASALAVGVMHVREALGLLEDPAAAVRVFRVEDPSGNAWIEVQDSDGRLLGEDELLGQDSLLADNPALEEVEDGPRYEDRWVVDVADLDTLADQAAQRIEAVMSSSNPEPGPEYLSDVWTRDDLHFQRLYRRHDGAFCGVDDKGHDHTIHATGIRFARQRGVIVQGQSDGSLTPA